MHKWKKAGILLSLLSVAEAGSSAYFYKRTMKRGMASTERTMKMAGTDWSQSEDPYTTPFRSRKVSGASAGGCVHPFQRRTAAAGNLHTKRR